ncbi:MAG: hypothetical protein IJI03_07790 [Rudaea sp.]|nr:hypothetical protein [Rudaea sp.]
MNTQIGTARSNPTQTFAWLLKREYWEHRGGFFWGPMIAGGVMIVIAMLTLIIAEATAARHGISINGMNLDAISRNMTADQVRIFNSGVTAALMGISVPVMVTLFFVVFFSLLGALYDDRRDRSVLFWKSLPISDLDTVLSKVATAVVVAPLFAIAATIVLHIVFLCLISVYAAFHGVNPLPLLWNPVPLVSMWIKLVCMIPLNALWALPTVGWLLLCSSFARSKPFLWAVALPVGFGLMVGFTQLLRQLSIPDSWYWKNIVARILFGVFPGGWFNIGNGKLWTAGSGDDFNFSLSRLDLVNSLLNWNQILNALGSLDLWLGAIAGVGLIAAAVYFRRRRTEAYS